MADLKHIQELLQRGIISRASAMDALADLGLNVEVQTDPADFVRIRVSTPGDLSNTTYTITMHDAVNAPEKMADLVLEHLQRKAREHFDQSMYGATPGRGHNPFEDGPRTARVPSFNGVAYTWPRHQPEETAGDGRKGEGTGVAGRDGYPGVPLASQQGVDPIGQRSLANRCVGDGCGLDLTLVTMMRHERRIDGPLCPKCYEKEVAAAVADKIQSFNEPPEGCY